MNILILKAIHIIAFVVWFSGLYYLLRIIVQHAETNQSGEGEVLGKHYSSIEKRLLKNVIRPAMLITFIAGIAMLVLHSEYLKNGWMHVKLLLVFLLAGFTESHGKVVKKLSQGIAPSAKNLRMRSEIPTIFLVAIVLLAVLRNAVSMGLLMGIVFGSVLLLAIVYYLMAGSLKQKP